MPDYVFRVAQRLRAGSGAALHKSSIASMLPERPIIVEAGAHAGDDTVELSKTWSRGEVHAFEPVPAVYRRLVDRTRRRRNVYCYPLALSSSDGWAEMHVSAGLNDSSSSLLAVDSTFSQSHPGATFPSSVTVPTTTLCTWAKSQGIDRVDFMWLDMQGLELGALTSSPSILEAVSAIYTEVWLQRLYVGCPLYAELRAFLEAHGFRVRSEFLPYPDAGNVLFVRESDTHS